MVASAAETRLTVSAQGYTITPARGLAEAAKAQADHAIECVKAAFQPVQQQVVVRYMDGGQVLLEVRCLVPDTQVDSCKKFALSGFDHMQDQQLQVSGPWPPCHFLPVTAKLPNRSERLMPAPGRLPLRSRVARA
jgi:hypothetical protein